MHLWLNVGKGTGNEVPVGRPISPMTFFVRGVDTDKCYQISTCTYKYINAYSYLTDFIHFTSCDNKLCDIIILSNLWKLKSSIK